MNIQYPPTILNYMSREDIVGHSTAWKVSDLGAVQYKHNYDPSLLAVIEEKALKLKEEHAFKKHLDLTFITGADRFIPEIKELINDQSRLNRVSDFAGTKLEQYPLSIVGTTVTFMGPEDGSVDWHCDGVPLTELIPLSISDPIEGGHLEIYMNNCEVGKSQVDEGKAISSKDIVTLDHREGYSTLGHFLGVLHRTAPIKFGNRVTLVMNLRSVAKPFVDDNRFFYLAADNDHDESDWIEEMIRDVREKQLPAYRKFEAERMMKTKASELSKRMS